MQIRLLDLKIRHKMEEKDTLLSMASGISAIQSDPNKVQTSGNTIGPMRYVDKVVDLEKDIDKMIGKYVRERDRIINQIHQLGDARYIELLSLKYIGQQENGRIHYMRLEEIACTMTKSNGEPYSYDHIRSMHGEALKRFSEIMQ
ncbi:MAG: hypothetical protein IKF59_13235 [Lachnospiraceae bacterium]|nr:hypothetical protein [Lachnospiraceae bacterium]